MSVDFSSLESLKKKDKNLGCVQSKTSSTRRFSIHFSMDHSGSRIPPANCWQIVRGQFGFVASTSQFPQVREEKKNKSPNFEKDACSTGKSIVADDRIFPPDSTFSYLVLYPFAPTNILGRMQESISSRTYVLLVRRRGKCVLQNIVFRDRKGKDARAQFDKRSRRDRTSFSQIKFGKRNCSREIDFSNFA